MKLLKYLLVILLIVQLFVVSVFTSFSLSQNEEISNKYTSTAEYLQSLPAPSVGSIGGEWLALGLARSDNLSADVKNTYLKNVEDYVINTGSARLHRNKSTENSRVIIGLASIGADARNIAGRDLISPLMDFDFVSKQGVNGTIWALIALDTYHYPITTSEDIKNPVTREKLIDEILSAQFSNGGWGLDQRIATPDMTSMAIQALAPYRYYDRSIQEAIDKGLDWLISVQTENGGFYSYDDLNPESCAQVIVALTTLDINPQDNARFNQSGKSVINSLLDFSVENGFEHTKGNGYNQMSTEQAFYALTAYNRFVNQQSALYDMSDVDLKAVFDYDGDGSESIKDVTYLQRFLAEYHSNLTTPQKRLADLNHNHKIDIGDVTDYQKKLAQYD